MIPKIIIAVIIGIYILAPYAVKKAHLDCQCGCREEVCYCCTDLQDSCDEMAIKKSKCSSHDESYFQFPAVLSPSPPILLAFDQIGKVSPYPSGTKLPGHNRPPMKPPPNETCVSVCS